MPDAIRPRFFRGDRPPSPSKQRFGFLRRVWAALLVPLLLLGGVPLGAQSLEGKTIEAIEFRGLQALGEDTLLYYLGLQAGQTVAEERLNEAIKKLWARNLVDDIEIDSEPGKEANSVRLIITVQERPVLRSIDYQGLKRLSRTDIQDKVANLKIRVREGDPLSLGELQRIKAIIEEMYQEKGYRFAEAKYKVEDLASNEKRVVFTVDEGDRVRIADIRFEGNEVYSDLRLRWAMKKTKETNLVTRIAKKDLYNPASVQEDLDKVRDLYRADGYKNVVLGEPQIEVRAARPQATDPKDQKRRLMLTIPIEEGDRWKFGSVSIDGNKVYGDEILLKVFEHREGAWLGAKVIDEGVKAVQDLYQNSGYIFARVQPELTEKPGQVADVVIHVSEGDQYKVGRIEFDGNDRTMDKVLRRELRLQEGRVMSIGAIRNSITKVNQLGYFKLNQEDPVKIDYDGEKKLVNLDFKGTEAERTELQFGGGWGEFEGFFGQFSIATKNFLGRGEQVAFSFQSGRFRDLFDLSYYVPWFLDRPQSIGVRAFNQSYDTDFLVNSAGERQRTEVENRGAALTYGRNLGLFQSLSVTYNRSQYRDRTTLDTTGAFDFLAIDSSSLRPFYAYDSRDNPFETTRGTRLTVGVEYAGGFLGGDSYLIRPDLTLSYFRPFGTYPRRTVGAFNLEAGLVDPFQGRSLTRLERVFLGGENSIRGHRTRSVSPRSETTGEPLVDALGFRLGGDRYIQANLEYHVLLGGPFRVLLFADAAQVYAEGQSFDLSRLRRTAGAELRVLVPVFGAPLRFIYAFNLDEKPSDEFENFQFSIGTSF
jgi:outer membrane protein insertion porin family